jgi:hypothetical protein
MSNEGLLAAAVLTALTLIIVGLPLLGKARRKPENTLVDKQRERLLVYYERVLRNIRDLDEDYALGKIDRLEYEGERELWAGRGAQVLKALDTLADQPMIAATSAEDAAVDSAIDDAIEAAVRDARRSRRTQTDRVVE